MRRSLALWVALAFSGASGCDDRTFVCPAMYTLTVTISPAAVSVPIGSPATFRAIVNGGLGGCGSPYQPGTKKVTWSVPNGTVATITSSTDTTVAVTGAKEGTTMVLATSVDDVNVKSAALLTVIRLPDHGP